MFPIKTIRNDFPSLAGDEIYFDSACQSLRPKQVMEAMNEYYYKYPACGERSLHSWGAIVTGKIEEARKTIAQFINSRSPSEIIFTKNTTEGINIIAHSLFSSQGGSSLGGKKRNVVITTDKEHNSNFLPWRILNEKGIIKHTICPTLPNGEFDLNEFEKILKKEKAALVSIGYSSNIDGIIMPADIIIKKAHEHGALTMLDAAQTIAHRKINVRELDVDFLAFSGHKILGPSGTGVLYGKMDLLNKLDPLITGGGTVASVMSKNASPIFEPPPQRFEAGLQNYAGIIGLKKAIDYIQKIGFNFIVEYEADLAKRLIRGISQIKKINIINPFKTELPLVSFYKEKSDAHEACLLLNNGFKIMTRSGHFCNHYYFNKRNFPPALRASLSFYNTDEEIDRFIEALEKIWNIL